MLRVRRQDLPFRGSSHHFVGADHGEVNASVFLFHGMPWSGPKPHLHPYGAGDILIIKAGEIHGFKCIGEGPLIQLDVHLSPRFIQEYPA